MTATARRRQVHVLHVDDDPQFADLTETSLERENDHFTVETAHSAEDALEMIDDRPPDCVVSDYDLPGQDGVALLRSVRDERPDLPFILLTGKGSEAVASEAISAGVTGYLRKQSGDEMYELLADRITDEVSRHRERTNYRELFNKADIGLVIDDPETGTILDANRTYADIVGYDRERIIGKNPAELSPGDSFYSESDAAQLIDDAIERGPKTFEWPHETENGDERWVEVTLRSAVLDGQQRVLASVVDITDRKAYEQQLERRNDLFRKAQEVADVGAWEYDIEKDRTTWTDQVYEIHGRPQDYAPDDGSAIELYHPDDRETLREAFRDAVENGDPYDLELRLLTRNGETRWVRTRGQPQTEDGALVRIRGAIRDITDRKRREQDLQSEERRYQSILNDPNLLVGILDTDGTLLESNRTAMEYIDAEVSDIVGEPFWETPWWPENLRAVVHDKIERAATGEYVTYEADLTKPDGDPYSVSGVIRPVTDDDDRIVSLVVSARDITERKERERDLRTEREFIQQALDALDDLFYVLDTDGTIRRWNQQVVEVTGYDPAELDGMAAVELFPEDDQPTIADGIEGALRDGEEAVRADLLTADGETIPYEWSGARLTDADGETTGIVGIGRDITRRRRRERRFRALVEESDDVISIVDTDGRFQYQSPSVERVLGYDPDNTIGDAAWEYIHPDDREAAMEMFRGMVTDPGTTVSSEYRVRRADGSWRWMEASSSNQPDASPIEGFVVNSRDITDRKEREQVLRIVTRMLRHNLRNDMNVIRGQAEMIRSEASGAVADDAARIVDVSDGLLEMAEKEQVVTEILQADSEKREVELGELLQVVVSTAGAEYPDATITVDCPDGATIETAAAELEQVISELVTNAIVHNESASPEVALTVTETDGTTRIDVADNGPPISEMERNILVDEAERTPTYHGQGVGLWLVKLITFRLGGTIVVEENSPTGNVVGIEFSE